MATLSYYPWNQGCTFPVWDIPLQNDTTGADNLTAMNVNLTSFSLTFHSTSGTDVIGTGTFTIHATNPAEVYYQPSAADVAAPFTGYLIPKALTNETPARVVVWDSIGGPGHTPLAPFPWQIIPS